MKLKLTKTDFKIVCSHQKFTFPILEDYYKREKESIKMKKTYGIKNYTFPALKI